MTLKLANADSDNAIALGAATLEKAREKLEQEERVKLLLQERQKVMELELRLGKQVEEFQLSKLATRKALVKAHQACSLPLDEPKSEDLIAEAEELEAEEEDMMQQQLEKEEREQREREARDHIRQERERDAAEMRNKLFETHIARARGISVVQSSLRDRLGLKGKEVVDSSEDEEIKEGRMRKRKAGKGRKRKS